MDKKIVTAILIALIVISAGTIVIFSGWLGEKDRDKTWASLSAVENDKVYIFTGQTDNIFTRPSPRIVYGVEIIAKIIHSDTFNVSIPYTLADDYVDWVTPLSYNYTECDEPQNEQTSITIVDAENRTICLDAVPLRIVSCSPSITEIVYEIGLGDRLVAVTDYCNWPQDVTARKDNGTLATIGGYITPSIESIAEADSDIVLLDKGVQAQMDMLSQLEDLDLKVVVLHKGLTFDEVYKNIKLVGTACGEGDRADGLITAMKAKLDGIQETIGDDVDKPTLAFAVWLDPIYLGGNGTFAHEMMTRALGKNIYSDVAGWPEIGLESLLERDPEFLLISMMALPASPDQIIQDLKEGSLSSSASIMADNSSVIGLGTDLIVGMKDALV